MSENAVMVLKISGRKTMFGVKTDMKKIADCSFDSNKHTVLNAKRNGELIKHSSSHKFIILLSTVILPFLLYQIVGNLTLDLICPDFSFNFKLYMHLYLLFSYWSITLIFCNPAWILLFTFYSSDELTITARAVSS